MQSAIIFNFDNICYLLQTEATAIGGIQSFVKIPPSIRFLHQPNMILVEDFYDITFFLKPMFELMDRFEHVFMCNLVRKARLPINMFEPAYGLKCRLQRKCGMS